MVEGFRRSRRGVSPVIAVILMIAISVAAAVMTYSWVMGMISIQAQQAQTAIRIDMVVFTANASVTWDGKTGDWINITIRNIGSVATAINTIYLTDTSGKVFTLNWGDTALNSTSGGNVIEAGNTETFTIDLPQINGWADRDLNNNNGWKRSSTYIIKVVTDTGFTVEASYHSPSKYPK